MEEKRGPGVYADKKAITGFLKSNSININQCIKKSVKGKEYYFATITNKGSKTEDIIGKILDITFQEPGLAEINALGRRIGSMGEANKKFSLYF